MKIGEFNPNKGIRYYLNSIVFYNGSHYISYVYDNIWHRCDDTIVREVSSIKNLVSDVIKIGMWPVALYYDTIIKKHKEISEDE